MMLDKIVSGGQTGVDRGALDAALAVDFDCGGWCPVGRKAEDGRIPPRYPVTELERGGYRARTIRNLVDSDGTLILYRRELDGGTRLTRDECERREQPWITVDAEYHSPAQAASVAMAFVDSRRIATLNVAGPRASKWTGGRAYAEAVIRELIDLARTR
ncbi:MAG: putative molybdenum carrier protein [Candidatus Wenzhouxiangella sp. M2_3B_020]